MDQREILKEISKLMDRYKVPYLLTGGLASSYYGYPRATHDIDFIIEIQTKDQKKIIELVKELGKDYLADKEQIKEAISSSSQFNILHLESGLKIDFWVIENNEFEKNKFRRSKRVFLEGQKINIVSAEDLILTKLIWCKEVKSERHLRDCAGIFKIQSGKLDEEYLNCWADKLKVKGLLKELPTIEY